MVVAGRLVGDFKIKETIKPYYPFAVNYSQITSGSEQLRWGYETKQCSVELERENLHA